MWAVVRRSAGAVMLGLMAVAASGPQTRPADSGSADEELQEYMRQCRAMFSSIEQTLRLVDQAENSRDSDERRIVLREARAQLLDMRRRIGDSLARFDSIRTGPSAEISAAAIEERWVCPMHSQVQQDRPGNCPICDATLRPSSAGSIASQPAVAVLDEPLLDQPVHAGDEARFRRSTTAR